jgi:hypothetical protein
VQAPRLVRCDIESTVHVDNACCSHHAWPPEPCSSRSFTSGTTLLEALPETHGQSTYSEQPSLHDCSFRHSTAILDIKLQAQVENIGIAQSEWTTTFNRTRQIFTLSEKCLLEADPYFASDCCPASGHRLYIRAARLSNVKIFGRSRLPTPGLTSRHKFTIQITRS